jgi:alpha-N-arabinofuranosidase
MERVNPSFIGRRQQHINFAATLAMEFTPRNPNECAGLVLLQNENHQIRCVINQNSVGDVSVILIRRQAGTDQVFYEHQIIPGRIYLKVEGRGQEYQFSVGSRYGEWTSLGEPVDGRVLSTPVAGGFTGAYIGMYTSSNGNPSDNVAFFDWFEYLGEQG